MQSIAITILIILIGTPIVLLIALFIYGVLRDWGVLTQDSTTGKRSLSLSKFVVEALLRIGIVGFVISLIWFLLTLILTAAGDKTSAIVHGFWYSLGAMVITGIMAGIASRHAD